jgi:murein DD-endopeptidase MepM/ murein hydrolase activator NlpD
MALGLLAAAAPALAQPHARSAIPAAKGGEVIHRVKEGDTLSAIAKRYRVSLRALLQANRLERPDLLRRGQRLVIPSGGRPGAVPAGPGGPAAVPPRHFVLTVPDLDGTAPAFGWPLEAPISSPFGRRGRGWHAGIDLKAEVGSPIFAAAAGTVYYSGWEKYYGRVVKLAHENGFVTVYAHNLQNFVQAGDVVEAGQVIGTVGRTGRASMYHLHFEIRGDGRVFNPVFLLPARELLFVPDEGGQPDETEEGRD